MPEPLTTSIENLLTEYAVALSKGLTAKNYIDSAGDYLVAGDTTNAGNALISAATWMGDFVSHLCRYSGFLYNVGYYRKECWEWVDGNWPTGGDPYELTMDKMLTAMWDGDLLRWFHFINYIDSMRAGIWNIEIYDTYLAEWYRHFSIA